MPGPIILPDPPVTSRPSAPRYRNDSFERIPDKIILSTEQDIVTEYWCWKYSNGRHENCWKVLQKITTTVTNEDTGFYVKTTENKYPWGCASYDFNPAHMEGYVWEYQR